MIIYIYPIFNKYQNFKLFIILIEAILPLVCRQGRSNPLCKKYAVIPIKFLVIPTAYRVINSYSILEPPS